MRILCDKPVQHVARDMQHSAVRFRRHQSRSNRINERHTPMPIARPIIGPFHWVRTGDFALHPPPAFDQETVDLWRSMRGQNCVPGGVVQHFAVSEQTIDLLVRQILEMVDVAQRVVQRRPVSLVSLPPRV